MQSNSTLSASLGFVAESTLGRLSRWLRLAGFDTAYDRAPPDAQRLSAICSKANCIILTRTRSVYDQLPPEKTLFISSNTPLRQAQYVIRKLRINRSDLNPMSRCVICNQPLVFLSKAEARRRVPDYIELTHNQFRCCPGCGRTYWTGTHPFRALELIDRWFEINHSVTFNAVKDER
jgi:uncharacterized protein with PIN domain